MQAPAFPVLLGAPNCWQGLRKMGVEVVLWAAPRPRNWLMQNKLAV